MAALWVGPTDDIKNRIICVGLLDTKPGLVSQVRDQNEIWKKTYFFGDFLSADLEKKLWE